MTQRIAPISTLFALILFWLAVSLQEKNTSGVDSHPTSVILPASAQVLLYGGDRFLAANIEEIRTATSITTENTQAYRSRAHMVASRLNPCHEDNYWIGNAALSWGGAEELGFELLTNAMHCRIWDEWPAFFYGFNQHFFRHDIEKARQTLEIAAQRSPNNSAAYRTFAIMLVAGKINDTNAALKLLNDEYENAKAPKLREMLHQRIVRLRGLGILQEAQTAYENQFGKPLTSPSELLTSGILEKFPDDPLELGYAFRDNKFYLHRLKIQ